MMSLSTHMIIGVSTATLRVIVAALSAKLGRYRLRAVAPVSRDESAVRAIQRPGVRP